MSTNEDVTQLLLDWSDGDAAALEKLMPQVVDELRKRASAQFRREDTDHTLQPTALVNEVYLRLVDRNRVAWRNRAHFFGFAVQTMRRILVDHARKRKADKRGAGVKPILVDDIDLPVDMPDGVDLLDLDAALHELAERSERQARVVELKFFGGMAIEEIAEVLDVGTATISRDWTVARAWLRHRLRQD